VPAYSVPELAIIALGLAATVLWLWAVVDCVRHGPKQENAKIIWVLVIVLGHVFGALLYLLFGRERVKRP